MPRAIIPPKTYYVYTYAYADGTVFYIGKGTEGRIDAHEKEASKGCGCRKCQVIRQIWQSKKPIQKRIVFETLDELEALEQERDLIQMHACAGLTNISYNPYAEILVAEEGENPLENEQVNDVIIVPQESTAPVVTIPVQKPSIIVDIDTSRLTPSLFDADDHLVTIQAVADTLGVSYKTILRLIEAKQLKASRVGRVWRIKKRDVKKFLWGDESHREQTIESIESWTGMASSQA